MAELTIVEAGAALRNGQISAVALTQELLSRATATQDTVAAFITITEVTALASGLGAVLLTVAGVLGLGWFGRLP